MRKIRTAVVDVAGELPELPLADADEWRFLVTDGNVPRAYVVIPSPGEAGRATLELVLVRHAERAREDDALRDVFRARLGRPRRPSPPLRVSLVIPTRRRPKTLLGLLGSVVYLDPAPYEVIVVDNDPGDDDCRSVVEAAGFTYVREDRRGLNMARRVGLHAATGDVVAFTDDDCLLSPGWLAALPELFEDPMVGVVAGPGLAADLDTGAQLRREEEAGFDKGLGRARYDWRTTGPPHSGVVGSGNSMAMRREPARGLEVFPPELDAGTRAPGAGDLYAIFRFLAAGFDAVYEPRMLFFHRHPPAGVRTTIDNYGWGVGAYYTKLLVEERELTVIALWYWFVRRWIEAVLDAQAGFGDSGRVAARWRYFAASLLGPVAWRRALRELDSSGRAVLAQSRAAASLPPPTAPEPDVPWSSVHPPVSVIVADVDGTYDTQVETGVGDEVIVERSAGVAEAWNAGAARARGEVLLFVDGRLQPQPGLIEAHAQHHGGASADVVVGHCATRPADRALATLAMWRDRETDFRRACEAGAPTYAGITGPNLSMPRVLFERVGEFDARVAQRPEREWAVRALEAGATLVHDRAAVVAARSTVTTSAYVAAALDEGCADAEVVRRHPHVAPAGLGAPGPVARAAVALCARPGLRSPLLPVLAGLEFLRLRTAWSSLAGLLRAGAYREGLGDVPDGAVTVIDVAASAPIPPPAASAPLVDLRFGSRRLARVSAPGGHWHHSMLESAHARVERPRWRAVAHVAAGRPGRHSPACSATATVVLGPAHGAGGRLAAEGLAVAGATVIEAEGGRGAVAHWSAVAAAVRSAETEIVALLLPGVRAGPAWLQEIVPALEGSRVAAVIGAGLASEDPPSPLGLFARPQLRAHYAAIGNAPQFIALRRDLYDQVGGLDPATARLGWHAPLLDFAERALDAGLVIGRLDTHGLDPAGCHRPARVLGEWDRAWARGGLFTQRGAQLGGIAGAGSFFWEGLLPHVRLRRPGGGGRRRIRRAAFSLVAFCLGAASALKPSPRRSRPGSA